MTLQPAIESFSNSNSILFSFESHMLHGKKYQAIDPIDLMNAPDRSYRIFAPWREYLPSHWSHKFKPFMKVNIIYSSPIRADCQVPIRARQYQKKKLSTSRSLLWIEKLEKLWIFI